MGGRVDWFDEQQLGFRNGSPIGLALTRLRETYNRHSRHRRYDDLTSTAPLETLRHKTGWLAIGTVFFDENVWMDGQPFEFASDPASSRTLPRPRDRIRLKEGAPTEPIIILDFGSRGEALRNRSPTTRPGGVGYISDVTGTRVNAGRIYTVADVQLEPIKETGFPGYRIVWVGLVAP